MNPFARLLSWLLSLFGKRQNYVERSGQLLHIWNQGWFLEAVGYQMLFRLVLNEGDLIRAERMAGRLVTVLGYMDYDNMVINVASIHGPGAVMETGVISAETFHSVKPSEIPDGTFDGEWGGYEATCVIDGCTYRLKTENGIRTMNCPCVVTIKGDSVTVRVKA